MKSNQLTRMEIAALKRMEKSLQPLYNQMAKLQEKKQIILDQEANLQERINRMEATMQAYVPEGASWQQILHPETIVEKEIPAEGYSEEEKVDEVEVHSEEGQAEEYQAQAEEYFNTQEAGYSQASSEEAQVNASNPFPLFGN